MLCERGCLFFGLVGQGAETVIQGEQIRVLGAVQNAAIKDTQDGEIGKPFHAGQKDVRALRVAAACRGLGEVDHQPIPVGLALYLEIRDSEGRDQGELRPDKAAYTRKGDVAGDGEDGDDVRLEAVQRGVTHLATDETDEDAFWRPAQSNQGTCASRHINIDDAE